jgi:hypothetical protein
MFPKQNMKLGECCACLTNTNVFQLRNCSHKLCSECFKKINFGSNINPKKWGHLESELNMDPPVWPFQVKTADNSDPEYVKTQEYQQFIADHFNIQTANYDELITLRNNLMATRSQWMNNEIFIQFENHYFKYITELLKSTKGLDDFKKMTTGGSSCPLCSKNSVSDI